MTVIQGEADKNRRGLQCAQTADVIRIGRTDMKNKVNEDRRGGIIYAVADQRQDYLNIIRGL